MRKSKAEPSKPRNTAMTESFDAGKLAEELRALVSEAEALLRASGSADGAEMQPRAEAAVRDLRERLSAFEEQLSARARDIDGYVRGNPWQAVAVAGGVALLLGLALLFGVLGARTLRQQPPVLQDSLQQLREDGRRAGDES